MTHVIIPFYFFGTSLQPIVATMQPPQIDIVRGYRIWAEKEIVDTYQMCN